MKVRHLVTTMYVDTWEWLLPMLGGYLILQITVGVGLLKYFKNKKINK
jgi:hypothetical protein